MRRENDAVEYDVVLADKVDQACIGVFPVLLPGVGFELLGGAYIAYRRVEPHVQHLAFGVRQRHGYAPVEVAGDGAGLEALVDPGLALAVYVGFPVVFVALYNPLAQPGFELVQREVPVFGGSSVHGCPPDTVERGLISCSGAEAGAAFLALVAVGVGVAAVGAGAHDVAVGEEDALLLVEVLV